MGAGCWRRTAICSCGASVWASGRNSAFSTRPPIDTLLYLLKRAKAEIVSKTCHWSMLLARSHIWACTRRLNPSHSLRFYSCQASPRVSTLNPFLLKHRPLDTTEHLLAKSPHKSFSSDSTLRQPQDEITDDSKSKAEAQEQRRKVKRNAPGKNSIRRVAVEAQRSRAGNELKKSATQGLESETKVRTEMSTA